LIVPQESAPNGINMPLSLNSGSAQIDSRGLMADLSQMSWHLDDRVHPVQLRYEPSSATTSQGTTAKTSKHDKQPTAPPRPPAARKLSGVSLLS
uniref:Transcriptional regulator n=1 Tax=Gongylonema pulchrum TaxID=637853 RepID=A0A183EYV6_9BILA